MGEDSGDTATSRRQRWIYSSHRIMNNLGNELFSSMVEFALNVASVVLIIGAYNIVRFSGSGYAISLAVMSVTFCMISCSLKFAIVLAVSCDTNSSACCTKGVNSLTNRNIENIKFWKAQTSIKIRVGEHFALQTKSYVLELFGLIILDNVISLLVTF